MNLKLFRKVAAAVSITAITLLGVGAPSVFADPSPAPTGNTSLIDPNAGVELKIHKYLGAASSTPGDGTEVSLSASYTPVAGLVFNVYRVYYANGTNDGPGAPVDLTTNAGWDAAAAVTGHTVTQAEFSQGYFEIGGTRYYFAIQGVPPTTGLDGIATFTKSAGAGLYLVNESVATSTNIRACTTATESSCTPLTASQLSPVTPFFVTLPMTDPNALSHWMYTVHVYPKNQADVNTKTVSDKASQTGDATGGIDPKTITYTIRSGITDGMDAATMSRYVITDKLDPRIVDGVITAYIDGDGDPNTTGDHTPLVKNTDYTPSSFVVLTFTQSGIGKLVTANTNNNNATVVTTIVATLGAESSDGYVPGTISNQAFVVPNQAWYDAHMASCTSNPDTCGVPTDATPTSPGGTPVLSKYGDVHITKVSPSEANKPLGNAEFAVYLDTTVDRTCAANNVSGDIVATGKTDTNGALTIKGLQVSDFYNGMQQTVKLQYCLVETKAPAGYNLNPEPVSFTIDASSATPSAPAFFAVTVHDQKSNLGNSLPLTGGEGVAALSLGGLVLIGGGVGYYTYNSRRRRVE